MKVESVLKAKGHRVETIRPDAPVAVAAYKLASMGIGALVVSTDGEHVSGIVSERDVVRALNKHGAGLLEKSVSDIASRRVPVCSPDDTLASVMAEMTRTRNRHLPVLVDGRLTGIISIGDVVKNRLEEMELEANVLRDAYIAGH